MIRAYAPGYDGFSDGFGIYGPRWLGQFGQIITLLKADPRSRRAVVGLWDRSDLGEQDRRDLPCTLSLQFLLRPSPHLVGKEQLHLIVTMRSNDVWMGLPYDVFAFTCLQMMVAEELGAMDGYYYHRVGSLHLYDKHVEAAHGMWRDAQPSACEHNWWPRATFKEVGLMLALELGSRCGVDPRGVTEWKQLSPMAQDLVACCARKWGFEVPLHSEILEQAHVDYRRSRPDRQNDTGAQPAEASPA
jgi:hypothetical protein